jgi:hypothetical protein
MNESPDTYVPVDRKVDWFQKPLRGHSYLDDKVSFAVAPRPDTHDGAMLRKEPTWSPSNRP